MNRYPLLAILILFYINLSAQDLSNLKNSKPFAISGNLSSTGNMYSLSGKESTRDPFTFLMAGNVDISVYGLHLPFSFMYSGQNLSYAQPFNQFGFSPEYKWIKVHLGYRSMNYSSYTLAGHSFMGVGVELNPGKLRLSGIYGRFKQKTIPNTANPLDTLFAPTRKGFSLKVGVGSQSNYFDLIFQKIADDSLSVDLSKRGKLKELQSNTVLGTHFRFKLSKSLVWETEGAVSLLTKNMADHLLNINNATLQRLSNLINLNASSEYSTAWNSSLMYTARLYSFGLQYRRISPNYQSFGAYYFNTDVENMTVNGKFSVFKRKLNVSGNLGLQRDNLHKNKATSSKRVISMVNANYSSGKVFSINGSYSNYSINQQAGRQPLNDTIKLYQTNRSISLMPMLTFNKVNLQQVIQLNVMLTNMIDHNPNTAANSEVSSRVGMFNYFMNYPKLEATFMTGLNYTSMTSATMNQTLYGISTDIGKTLFHKKLSTNISVSINRSDYMDIPGWVNSGGVVFTFRPHKKHLFKLNFIQIMNSYPDSSIVKSFTETKSIFSYVYRI